LERKNEIDVTNGLDVCIRNSKRLKHRKAFSLDRPRLENRRKQNDYAVAKPFLGGIRATT
jgi:hypothetical protein